MTPIARVVYSPFVQLVIAATLVAAILIALLRPSPTVVVMIPPSPPATSAPTIVAPVAFPLCVYGWYGWRGYCRD